MLFYKVEGMLMNTGAENEDSRRARREAARTIYTKSEACNRKWGRDTYCFVSESSDGLLTAGIIVDQASRLLAYDFDAITAEEIKTIKAEDIVIPEVTTEIKRTIGFAC